MGSLHIRLIVRVSYFEVYISHSFRIQEDTQHHRELVSGVALILSHAVVENFTLRSWWRFSVLQNEFLRFLPPNTANTVPIFPRCALIIVVDVTETRITIHKIHVVEGYVRGVVIVIWFGAAVVRESNPSSVVLNADSKIPSDIVLV